MFDVKDTGPQNKYKLPGYVPVTCKEQLWRFQVGRHPSNVNFGDDYICFFAYNGQFLRAAETRGLCADRSWCKRDERYKVEFDDAKTVTITTVKNGEHFSCLEDGFLGTLQEKGERERFVLYVDKDEDNLVLCNKVTHKVVTVADDCQMYCNEDQWSFRAKFRGWKTGSKAAWQPRDRWKLVNAAEAHSNANSVLIGVECAPTPMAGTVVQMEREAYSSIYDAFVAHIATMTETNWSKTSKDTWFEAKRRNAILAPEDSGMKVFQAVGEFGCFLIHSGHFEVMIDH